MKFIVKPYIFLVFLLFIWACDDGNIIVSSFDFDEETNLSLCQQEDINVLYFIDPNTNEAISFTFTTDDFDGTFEGLDESVLITFNLNSTNQVVYRKLSESASGSNYYCQEVPPSSPQVLEEFISTTGGTATLEIRITDQDDDDGIPAELEDINGNGDLTDDDTDGDGIPDFIDTDDDNDNVLTISEKLEVEDENGNIILPVEYTNTDNDMLPNYRDDDDDGDGIPTRNEDLNVCDDPENPALNPSNDINAEGLENYLNNTVTNSLPIDVVKVNNISRDFLTQVVFTDITFENQNNDESLTFTSFIMGRYTTTSSQNIPYNDTTISEEDVENICQ